MTQNTQIDEINSDNMNLNETIYQILVQKRSELVDLSTKESSKDETLAARLHEHYNVLGREEGWLKPEYDTPLSEQDNINQRKNIDAALDVLKYWIAAYNH